MAKKLSDGGGLYLFITPVGGALWRIKYRVDGKEKTYSIDSYPAVSLAAARVDLAEVSSYGYLRLMQECINALPAKAHSSFCDDW